MSPDALGVKVADPEGKTKGPSFEIPDTLEFFPLRGYNPGMSRRYLPNHLLRDGRLFFSRYARPPIVSEAESEERLHAAYGWISQSVAAVHGEGSSKAYSYLKGWLPAYPETSGYIISSLIEYGNTRRVPGALEAAQGIARWLGGRINADGGIPAIRATPSPSLAFDTGMVLQGLTGLSRAIGDPRCAELAHRCAGFLVETQGSDGSWTQDYGSIPHAYHARVAWPLLDYGLFFANNRAQQAACANLAWVIARQRENGMFAQAYFTPQLPYVNTHSLGYIVEGLLESFLLTNNRSWLASARKTADRLLIILEENHGFLPGYFREDWRPKFLFPVPFACLTGMAQLARCWFLLYRIEGDEKYREAGDLCLSFVVQYQDLKTSFPAIRGGLPGSAPFFGRYLPLRFPNWAAKFLMDALLTQTLR